MLKSITERSVLWLKAEFEYYATTELSLFYFSTKHGSIINNRIILSLQDLNVSAIDSFQNTYFQTQAHNMETYSISVFYIW